MDAVSCASARRFSRRRSANAAGLFSTEYFDEGNAYPPHDPASWPVRRRPLRSGKIYTFEADVSGAEKSKTRRHLTEFWMIEPEVAFNDTHDKMRLQEDYVSFLVQRVLRAARRRTEGSRAGHHEARERQGAVPADRLRRRGPPTLQKKASIPVRWATISAPRMRRCWWRITIARSS